MSYSSLAEEMESTTLTLVKGTILGRICKKCSNKVKIKIIMMMEVVVVIMNEDMEQ